MGFTARQDYFTHFEPSQSVGGAKTGDRREKLLDHLEIELGFSHRWPELGSNPQRLDDEQFRELKISVLNHSATDAAVIFLTRYNNWFHLLLQFSWCYQQLSCQHCWGQDLPGQSGHDHQGPSDGVAQTIWSPTMQKCIRAPSSEFVSSSIPLWPILTAHAQPFRGARDLAFCLKVPLDSLFVWASSGGSGETARMRRLAWTFAARIGDKYQIRLARPIKYFWTV